MIDLTLLKNGNPEIAAQVELWVAKFQKSYDFGKTEDQADFYEAMSQFGKITALNSYGASISISANGQGITYLEVCLNPLKPSPSLSD